MFAKNNSGDTPFKRACEQYEYEPVMKVIKEVLIHNYSEEVPFNGIIALLYASIHATIHLDCAYYLLRWQPDMLVDLQLITDSTITTSTINNNSNESIDSSIDTTSKDGNDGGGSDNSSGNDIDNRNHDNKNNHKNSEEEGKDDNIDTDTSADANKNNKKWLRNQKRKRDSWKNAQAQ